MIRTIIKKGVLVFLVFGLSGMAAFGEDVRTGNREIDRVNRQIKREGFSWKAGMTSMSLLSPAARRHRIGLRHMPVDPDRFKRYIMKELAVPSELSWLSYRGKNWMTSVKDQGSCGSCYAFAPVGVVEAMYKIETNSPSLNLNLSEQHIVSCESTGDCEQGGFPSKTFEYIQKRGIPSEKCFPYKADDVPCDPCSQWEAAKDFYKLRNWEWVTGSKENRAAVMEALQNGPLSGYMKVYTDFYHYRSGIYKKTQDATYEGDHGIIIVGYNADGKYWICKNSWGSDWGEDGFFRAGFGQVQIGLETLRCSGITTRNSAPALTKIGDRSVLEMESLYIELVAEDPDGDTVVYGCDNLPEGATLNEITGEFRWTPDHSQSGVYNLIFTASDGAMTGQLTVRIEVVNVKKGRIIF